MRRLVELLARGLGGMRRRAVEPVDRHGMALGPRHGSVLAQAREDERTVVRIPSGQERVVDTWLDGATAPLGRALRQLSAEERATFVMAPVVLEAELNPPADNA